MSAESPPDAPVRKQIPIYRETLEKLLLSLRKLPPKVDRGPLKGAIEASLASLTLLSRSEVTHDDHLALLDDLVSRIAAVRAGLSGTEGVVAAARAARSLRRMEASVLRSKELTVDVIVADQQRTLRRAARDDGEPARTFRASTGVPALHTLVRPPLTPLVDLSPATDDDEDEDEDKEKDKEEDKGGQRDAGGPLLVQAEIEHVRALARGTMEDIAILGNLRRLNEGEPWSAAERFERRLLANLDAFAALSVVEPGAQRDVPLLEELLRYAAETTFADPGRAFAKAFVLGCVDGEDSLRALILGLRQAHPTTLAAQRDALSLASNPAIEPAMGRLLWDEDPALVRIALEVLRYRRKATFAGVAPLLSHPDPDVQHEAIRCLGVVEPSAEAAHALEQALADGGLDRVCLAAAQSLLSLGFASGLTAVTRALEEEDAYTGLLPEEIRAAYVRLLALAGGPEEADLLRRSVHHESSGALSIGWYGHIGLVEPLLAKLESANDLRRTIGPYPTPFERAAAEALARITGAYLENQDEALDVALSVDAGEWRAYYEMNKQAFNPRLKYRFGKPYHPRSSLEELCDESAPDEVRRCCAMELSFIARRWAFEPADWVARQRVHIEALRAELGEAEARYRPGEWPAHHLTHRSAPNPRP